MAGELMRVLENMGVILWPMLVCAAFLGFQIVRASSRSLRTAHAHNAMTRHAILVWGSLAALLGLLGTVVGLVVAAGSVVAAGEAAPALIAGGLQVALSSTVFGLLLLAVAIVVWLLLQTVTSHGDTS